jgi:hypothetical protein
MEQEHKVSAEECYIESTKKTFLSLKSLSDRAFQQMDEKDFHYQFDSESNTIAVLIKHLAGNMISRWTDFLTTDGEKSSRDRDNEFVDDIKSKTELLELWERGWKALAGTFNILVPRDLTKTVYIRGEAHTVIETVNGQLSHCAYHTGQIVYAAKLIKSSEWKTLFIPRGKSREFLKPKKY